MSETINSIAFQDNYISWVQAEVTGGQSVSIKRVAEGPLPFILNYDNLQKTTTALQIANQLKGMAEKAEFSSENVRFLLSARMGFVKKVLVDQFIPENQYLSLIKAELNYILTSPVEEFIVYQPDYERELSGMKELLAVAIRKQIYEFTRQIAREAGFQLSQMNLNCFAIDEIFRKFFPNVIGQTLLVNFTERGLEFILSDEKNFLNFTFKPYTRSMLPIDQLNTADVFSVFEKALQDFQKMAEEDSSAYSITQVFLFGYYFKSDWLGTLRDKCQLPLRVFNPLESTEWQVLSEDENLDVTNAYRFVEPLSNIF
ncbi:MAG: hypothetical protein D6748_01205 [Calditrichaeota bacterium]|nr:MAG: hypothetical protein D6748_01205 [Calditrichota bacterium]